MKSDDIVASIILAGAVIYLWQPLGIEASSILATFVELAERLIARLPW